MSYSAYSEYQDAEADWLDAIPADWDLLPGMCSLVESKTPNKGMIENTVLSLSYGNIIIKPEEKLVGLVPESFETYQLVEPGDIIVRCTDLQNDQTSLRTGLAKNRGIITSAYLNLRPKTGYSSRFLHYYLHALDTSKILYKFGSGLRQNLSFEDFKRLPVPSISKDKQIRIADFLDEKTAKIDEAIGIKERQIELLKERKQILIQNAVTRGLNPDSPLKDSGVDWIGQIPAHWNIVANRALFREAVDPGEEGLPLLSVSIHSGVSTGELDSDQNIQGRVKIEDKSKYNRVEEGDVVFNMMRAWQGAIGAVSVKGMVSPAYIIARPCDELDAIYFECQYRSPIFIQQMDRFSKGITDFRKRLYWDEFKQLITVLPPVSEQREIKDHIQKASSQMDKAVEQQQKQIEKLKEYKASLINSAVTGKIKVA